MSNTVTFGRCEGCEQTALLEPGQIVPRFVPGSVLSVEYCAECWDIVDNADPKTGAFGAGCCDVKRWVEPAHTLTNPPLLEYEDSRDNIRQP